MKKIVVLALILIVTVCLLSGCGGGSSSSAPSDKPAAAPAPADKPAAAPAPAADSQGATAEQLKQLQQKNVKLAAVYNELAPLAVKNGWDADPVTVKVLNAAEATIQAYNGMIKDPSLTKGADMSAELSAADELIKILDVDLRANVSNPFSGK